MYYVYILKCSDNLTYVGFTTNIRKRIKEHNEGMVHHTKSRLPIKLSWLGIFTNKTKAAIFEQYLKSGSGISFFKRHLI
ncbi:MAG: GIY-YIG nuclease family protein [Patescibacteria group bacterium]|jgi:predicted GIY-YIG superfamily endonuclease